MGGTSRRRPWLLALQLGVTLLVLGVFFGRTRPEALRRALESASPGWLAAAFLARLACYSLHEARLWYALEGALPLRRVLGTGFLGGLFNTFLPVRGGDALVVGLLLRQGVGASRAVLAVSFTAATEALGFGLFLLAFLALGLFEEEGLLPGSPGLPLLALGSLGLAVVLLLLALLHHRLIARLERARGRLAGWAAQALRIVGGPRRLAAHAVLLALNLAATLASTAMLLPAAGLEVKRPVELAALLVLAGSLLGSLLPASLGGGRALGSVLLLSLWGVSGAGALVFAALEWASVTLATLLLGLPPLWSGLLRGGAGELVAAGERARRELGRSS